MAVPPVDGATEWQIAVAQSDGSRVRRLTDGSGPVWSPDSTRIAFQRYDQDQQGPSVYVIGADGTGLDRVAAGGTPAWAPDGSAVTVWRPDLSVRPPGDGVVPIPEALFVVELDGGGERQLTPFEVRDTSGIPAWSPDGRMIAAGDRLLGIDGTVLLRLDPGDTWGDLPWSPDGEDLVVMDGNPERTGGAAIGVLSVDTGEVRGLVPTGDDARFQLSWSPDGQCLIFGRHGANGLRIAVVPAAGGEPQAIGPEDSQSPLWQPIVSHPLD
jgi:Tol biopolymer transport system component